jgi:hypothetical protein
MNLCKKLPELPPVLTEWQGAVWRPECEHYDDGACDNPARAERDAPCPLDGQPLPLRQVVVAPGKDMPQECSGALGGRSSDATEQAVRDGIVRRTGGRVRMLAVEVQGELVVIRGWTSCYYLKQLAIQAVLEVVGFARPVRVELDVPATDSRRS